MPHERPRHLRELFEKLVRHSRIVGILGHRQVGKTTFLKAVASEYATMDDEATRARAERSASRFVASLKARRSAIDECQLVPGLFPAMKVRIGTSSIPGRFILSGSVRFTSRKAIRESLTGRIANLEMLPFSLTEIEKLPNSSFFPNLIRPAAVDGLARSLILPSRDEAKHGRAIETYMERGGFPGLFSIRDDRTRGNLLRDIVETVLDRDLRLVHQTSLPFLQIHDFCRELAANPMEIPRPARLRARVRMAEATQKLMLMALEGIFLLRRIPLEGDYKGCLFWFEDQLHRGHFLQGAKTDGADWTTLVYRNLRAQFDYRLGELPRYFAYRTRGGAEMPVCVRTREGVLGICPLETAGDLSLSHRRSADSFLKTYDRAKVAFVTRHGRKVDSFGTRTLLVPAQIALF